MVEYLTCPSIIMNVIGSVQSQELKKMSILVSYIPKNDFFVPKEIWREHNPYTAVNTWNMSTGYQNVQC